ncbi:MAG: histidinol-phosphatase, partial [Thermoanaerobaculia bacterium]|nr:histidinol-phosphatase [Thermoanaerobaculia bacterium]
SGVGTDLAAGAWRPLRVSEVGELSQAFLCHGGLIHFQNEGLWPALGEIVAIAGRTRGFGDWWGHTLVADGRCDAMIDPRVAYHDVAAIEVLVREAGGVFATAGDRAYGPSYLGPALSCNRRLAEELGRRLGL